MRAIFPTITIGPFAQFVKVSLKTLTKMYIVYDSTFSEPFNFVFLTRADAEEFIITLCEDYAYGIMMTESPKEIFGRNEWHWKNDYSFLMEDAIRDLNIQEAFVYA